MTAQYIAKIIKGARTEKQVRTAMDKAKLTYEVRPVECCGKTHNDFWVGNIRIFKRYGEREYVAWEYSSDKFKYSGVPVFMPSSIDTFDIAL